MNSSEPFPYTGQSRKYIPRDVTHVKVDPTVKVIGEEAFMGRRKLRSAAFQGCTLLERINIPSTVKAIGVTAFLDCSQFGSS